MAVVGTGRTPASPHPLPPHPHPGERRDPGDGTKAKPGRGGGPRCRERRAVGRGTPGAASPFCGGAQPVTRGPRGRRTGGRTAPGGAPPAAPEVRDKYPPGPSQGRGGVILGPAARLGTCPGRTATCVGGGVVPGELNLSSIPSCSAETSWALEQGVRWSGVQGASAGPVQRVCAPENLLRYGLCLASLPAPRYRLGKKRRP